MDDFVPPFCRRRSCVHHHEPDPRNPYVDWVHFGSYETKAFGTVPRYRCKACGATFSRQTFRVDYYAKRVLPYDDIGRRLVSCESLSAIGRAYKSSTDTISNRISRGSRQAEAFESRVATGRQPSEDLAADGFESFCRSQFFPTNINILVGSDSQFVYAADQVTLRRKGRMTQGQKRKRAILDTVYRPPPRAIETSFAKLSLELPRLLGEEGRSPLTLWTDEHQAYPRGLRQSSHVSLLLDSELLKHRTISSRAARTVSNPLFPVNYLDREIRKDLHEHVRETTCFGRNVNRQMERLSLYLYWHNYRKVHRARNEKRSHAEVAGYDHELIEQEMKPLWIKRAWLSLIELSDSVAMSWMRSRRTPLIRKRDYLPKYALM